MAQSSASNRLKELLQQTIREDALRIIELETKIESVNQALKKGEAIIRSHQTLLSWISNEIQKAIQIDRPTIQNEIDPSLFKNFFSDVDSLLDAIQVLASKQNPETLNQQFHITIFNKVWEFISSLIQKTDELEKENTSIKNTLKNLKEELASLQQQLAQSKSQTATNATITELQQTNAEMTQQILKLQVEIEQQKSLQQQLTKTEHKLFEKEKECHKSPEDPLAYLWFLEFDESKFIAEMQKTDFRTSCGKLAEEFKKRIKQLQHEHHPDQNQGQEKQHVSIFLNEILDNLKDPRFLPEYLARFTDQNIALPTHQQTSLPGTLLTENLGSNNTEINSNPINQIPGIYKIDNGLNQSFLIEIGNQKISFRTEILKHKVTIELQINGKKFEHYISMNKPIELVFGTNPKQQITKTLGFKLPEHEGQNKEVDFCIKIVDHELIMVIKPESEIKIHSLGLGPEITKTFTADTEIKNDNSASILSIEATLSFYKPTTVSYFCSLDDNFFLMQDAPFGHEIELSQFGKKVVFNPQTQEISIV